jgi:hypothetical protein
MRSDDIIGGFDDFMEAVLFNFPMGHPSRALWVLSAKN